MLNTLRSQIRVAVLPVQDMQLSVVPAGALVFPDDLPPVLSVMAAKGPDNPHLVACDASGNIIAAIGGSSVAPLIAPLTGSLITRQALLAQAVMTLTNPNASYSPLSAISGQGVGVSTASTMQPSSFPSAATPAVNVAAVITVGGVANQRTRLTMLAASYNAAPTGGNLLVQDGATTVFSLDLTAAGLFLVPLPPGGIQGSVNTTMTVTLAAAGAAVTGKLSVATLQF